LNFLSHGFRSRLNYQLVFRKMNPHSSVNLLKQVFKQWNTHLDKQTLEITKKLIWVIKEQNLQNLFCIPCICMFRNDYQWNLIYFALAWHVIGSLQKEETLLIFSGKEVGLARSLLDKQHVFTGFQCKFSLYVRMAIVIILWSYISWEVIVSQNLFEKQASQNSKLDSFEFQDTRIEFWVSSWDCQLTFKWCCRHLKRCVLH